jgi:hypothetical protein
MVGERVVIVRKQGKGTEGCKRVRKAGMGEGFMTVRVGRDEGDEFRSRQKETRRVCGENGGRAEEEMELKVRNQRLAGAIN